MKLGRSVLAGLVMLVGVTMVATAQPSVPSVAADYLVRNEAISNEATSETLEDWEYTGRRRPVKCRGF